jgi:Lrp/AsnC family transcriptional regulator, leucine-responsive regulatory protein
MRNVVLDEIDRRIIATLAADARMSLKELAARAGLSSPSASERLRRLEERGIVTGFTVEISPKAMGFELQAVVRIRPLPGMLHAVERLLQDTAEIVECDKVTGEDCFVARLYVRSMEQLDSILDSMSAKAETNSAIVKAQPIKRRLPPLD